MARWVAAVAVTTATAADAACFVSAVALQFGPISPPLPADSIGDITVTCNDTPGARVRYTLSLGAGLAGTFAPRRMTSAEGGTLQYNLYVDPARVTVWGDGTNGTATVSDASSMSGAAARHHPVYGRIFGGQRAPAGAYSDAIVLSLDF